MELTEEQKRTIWERGVIDDKYPSEKIRKDGCGAFICYGDFGNRDSIFGWRLTIFIRPVSWDARGHWHLLKLTR